MAVDLDRIIQSVTGAPTPTRKQARAPRDRRGLTCNEAALVTRAPKGWDFDERANACRKVRAMIAAGDGRGNINSDRVIIVALGLGRDSFTMLGLLEEGKLRAEGHRVRPQDVDAIVFSDPGAEWKHSMTAIADAQRFADDLGIPFYWLKKPLACEYEPMLAAVAGQRQRLREQAGEGVAVRVPPAFTDQFRKWRQGTESLSVRAKAETGYYHILAPIIEDFSARERLVLFKDKNCTVNHKIVPMRRLIEDLSIDKFNLGHNAWGAAVARGERVPHLSLVGIARDESSADPASRHARDSKRHPYNPDRHTETWSSRNKRWTPVAPGPWFIDEAYPLVESGITKDGEQAILERHGLGHVAKSGCFMCPFQPTEWYWVLGMMAKAGDPWAVHALGRLAEAERITLASGKGGPRIRDKRVQGQRTGTDRLTVEQAIPIIEAKLIAPIIEHYRVQGLSDGQARKQAMAAILRKDYAQGCKLGSVNRLVAWSHSCGGPH